VSALLRYQGAILARSYRWVFPLIVYGALIAVGAAGSTPLAETLDWSAAMLVPVVAFLTRAMVTAEPDAARACVAAATGPARAQLAALGVALGGGALLGVASVVFGVLTAEAAAKPPPGGLTVKVTDAWHHPGIVAAGLVTALICLLVGSAIGALCNPPLLRHPGVAMLTTLGAVILGLVAHVSPAAAALRNASQSTGPVTAHWPGAVPLISAVCVLAVTWTASALAATRRDSRSVTTV
jgi:hypothetical protein